MIFYYLFVSCSVILFANHKTSADIFCNKNKEGTDTSQILFLYFYICNNSHMYDMCIVFHIGSTTIGGCANRISDLVTVCLEKRNENYRLTTLTHVIFNPEINISPKMDIRQIPFNIL